MEFQQQKDLIVILTMVPSGGGFWCYWLMQVVADPQSYKYDIEKLPVSVRSILNEKKTSETFIKSAEILKTVIIVF